VLARRYSRRERLGRWARRRRAELAVACVLGALLIVVAVASAVRIVHERDQALTERADAVRARMEATRQNDALVLLQAGAELTRDPTASLAWLKRYPEGAKGWATAVGIAADAWSRGVAHDVWDLGKPVGSVAFSPDGRSLAVGTADELALIELASGRLTSYPAGRAGDGVGDRVVFSPDGTVIATTDGHDAVRLWDRATGRSRRLPGDAIGGANIQFSADGALLLVRHSGGGARLWRLPAGEPVALPGDDARLAAFVAGTHAIAVAVGSELSLVDLDTGKTTAHTRLDAPPYDLWASGDGAWIGAALFDALALWNPVTGAVRRVAPGKPAVALLTPSLDGAYFMSCGRQVRELWLFDVAAGAARRVADGEGCRRQAFAFSPDGTVFVSAGFGGEVRLHLLREARTRVLIGHQASVSDAAFSPDGRLVASAGSDHTVRLWRWTDGDVRVLHDTVGLDRASVNGRLFARDTRSGAVSLIDVGSGSREPVTGVRPQPRDTCMSGNGEVAALLYSDRTISVRDLAGHGERVVSHPELASTGDAPSVLSASGRLLAQIDPGGVVRVVELATGQVRRLARLGDVGIALMFSADERWLAVGGRDGTARVLEVGTGRERARLVARGWVWNLVFTRDAARLAAAYNDGFVRVIDVASGEVRELAGHVGAVLGLDFTADGAQLLSSGADGTVRIWDLATGAGTILHREPGAVSSAQFVAGTSLVLEGSTDARVFRIWDLRALPPPGGDPAALRRWLAEATSAEIDTSGRLRAPPPDRSRGR
jgi:WD40 repeat protein